jgi:hypothetical protein
LGVHKKEVYPEIKMLLEIPQDEPIFIIRAQDALSRATINRYARLGNDTARTDEFMDGIIEVEEDFMEWQNQNRNRVKLPD